MFVWPNLHIRYFILKHIEKTLETLSKTLQHIEKILETLSKTLQTKWPKIFQMKKGTNVWRELVMKACKTSFQTTSQTMLFQTDHSIQVCLLVVQSLHSYQVDVCNRHTGHPQLYPCD